MAGKVSLLLFVVCLGTALGQDYDCVSRMEPLTTTIQRYSDTMIQDPVSFCRNDMSDYLRALNEFVDMAEGCGISASEVENLRQVRDTIEPSCTTILHSSLIPTTTRSPYLYEYDESDSDEWDDIDDIPDSDEWNSNTGGTPNIPSFSDMSSLAGLLSSDCDFMQVSQCSSSIMQAYGYSSTDTASFLSDYSSFMNDQPEMCRRTRHTDWDSLQDCYMTILSCVSDSVSGAQTTLDMIEDRGLSSVMRDLCSPACSDFTTRAGQVQTCKDMFDGDLDDAVTSINDGMTYPSSSMCTSFKGFYECYTQHKGQCSLLTVDNIESVTSTDSEVTNAYRYCGGEVPVVTTPRPRFFPTNPPWLGLTSGRRTWNNPTEDYRPSYTPKPLSGCDDMTHCSTMMETMNMDDVFSGFPETFDSSSQEQMCRNFRRVGMNEVGHCFRCSYSNDMMSTIDEHSMTMQLSAMCSQDCKDYMSVSGQCFTKYADFDDGDYEDVDDPMEMSDSECKMMKKLLECMSSKMGKCPILQLSLTAQPESAALLSQCGINVADYTNGGNNNVSGGQAVMLLFAALTALFM